jgi:hypothetical protein
MVGLLSACASRSIYAGGWPLDAALNAHAVALRKHYWNELPWEGVRSVRPVKEAKGSGPIRLSG